MRHSLTRITRLVLSQFIALFLLLIAHRSRAQGPLHFRMQRVSTETYESVGAFDVNGDGRPDLAVAGKDGLCVFFNEGVLKQSG